MKRFIRIGLTSSLALGALAFAAVPALAQDAKAEKKAKKEKPAAKVKANLTPAFEKEISQVQKLVAEKKAAEAEAKLAVAAPLAQTPDDKYYVGAMRQSIAVLNNNNDAQLMIAIAEQLDSGSALMPATSGAQFSSVLGRRAYDKNDYATAVKRLEAAQKYGANDGSSLIFLADSYVKTGRTAEGIAIAKKAIEAERAAGRKPPSSWFTSLRSSAYKAGLAAETGEWSRMLVAEHPTPDNLHDMAGFYINIAKPGDRPRVDAFRLMYDTKSMIAGSEYTEFADLLIRVKMPGEAAAVLKEGMANGKIPATSQKAKDLMPTDAAIAADRASLNQSEKGARAAATGGPAANNAEAFMGYGEYAKAIDLYRLALTKGGAGFDADETNLRLGIALLKAGQKAEATAAFAKVGGQRAELAKHWATWAAIRT